MRRTMVAYCHIVVHERSVESMFLSIILYSSCIAYDGPGLSPRHFLVFYLCSRVGPLPYNPARHPAFIKAPRLLGPVSSHLFVLVVATADPHLLSLPRSSILRVPQARQLQCWRCTLSYPCYLPPGKCLPELRHLPRLSFLLSASFLLAYEVQEARFHFLLTHSVCCACRAVSGWSSPSGARAGCSVRCDSCHVVSWCIGLFARACGLIALQCTLCAFVPTLAHL
jgi:hypothetical protein